MEQTQELTLLRSLSLESIEVKNSPKRTGLSAQK